jgi:hypothetical protein
MKKWLVGLLLMLGLWGWHGHRVQAQTFEGYDPVQGGMIFDPPESLYAAVGVRTVGMFMYSDPGSQPLSGWQTKQTHSTIEIWEAGEQSSTMPASFSLGMFSFTPAHSGEYTVKLQFDWGNETYTDTIAVHVLAQLPANLHANVDQKRLFTNVLRPIEWVDHMGRVFSMNVTIQNKNLGKTWPIGPYTLPPEVISASVPVLLTIGSIDKSIQYEPAPVYFGIEDVTLKEGVPLTLDVDYYHPRVGTTLSYVWTWTPPNSEVSLVEKTGQPRLAIPETWRRDGKLTVALVYHDNATNSNVTALSNTVQYHYEPAPKPALPDPTLPHQQFSVTELITHNVELSAGLTPITVPAGAWQLVVAITAPTGPAGTLAAALRLPGGQLVQPHQPVVLSLPGPQTLSLAQTQWLLYRQPDVLRGHYQATVSFTTIMGP